MALIKEKIIILVSIPITLIFIIGIISQYYALLYTRDQNNWMQERLFDTQIMYSKLFTQQISNQLSQEMQKIPFIITLLNQYLSKLINGKVIFNEQHVSSIVHLEKFHVSDVDPKIIEMFKRSSLLINCWFHMNYTSLDQLDDLGRQKLRILDRLTVLQRAIEYEGVLSQQVSKKKLKINDILQTFQHKGLYAISGLNTTLKNQPKIPTCTTGIDPRCRFWYSQTATEDTVQIYEPNFIYATKEPSLATLACQRVQVFNQNTNQNELENVLCLDLRFGHTQNYFQNFANSTKQIYFIEPKSQTLLFNSQQHLGVTSIEKLQNEEFKYLDSQEEAKYFNDTLKKFYSNNVFKKINKIDIEEMEGINSYNQTFSYERNGTNTEVIMNPVFIFDKLPKFEGVIVPPNREKFQIKIPYVQINIISNEELRQEAKLIEEFFNKYYLYFNISFGIVGLISLLFIAYYSNIVKNMFNESIDHLTKILTQMTDQELSIDIFDMITDDRFLSQETLQLYHSFKEIYQILLYTSENFFNENETKTLLKLNRNIEFFKQFGNNQAVGITFNNIGSILLSQGHYFQALEHFSTSILYAKYEIQDFCNQNPLSISSVLLSEFCYTKVGELPQNVSQQVNNQYQIKKYMQLIELIFNEQIESQNRVSSIKTKKNSSLFCQQKELEQEHKLNEDRMQQQQTTANRITSTKRNRESNIHKTQLSDPNQIDEFYEERQLLLSNLFYRKKNYITTLLAFQENFDNSTQTNLQKKSYNFWLEIKKLSKKLLILAKQMPQCELLEVEINSLLSKCYFKLEKQQKSKLLLSNCKNSLNSLATSIVKQQGQDMDVSWRNKQIFSFSEKQKSNDFIVRSLYKKPDQQTRDEDCSQRTILRSPMLLAVNHSAKSRCPNYQLDSMKEEEEMNKSGLMHVSQMNPLLSQNFNSHLRNNRLSAYYSRNSYMNESSTKSPNQRLNFSNQVTPSKRLTSVVQVSNKKDIENMFESQRKLESNNEVKKFLHNYLSKDSLEIIINFTEVELLIAQQQYQKAAQILTELLEEKKQIISHYNFKIVDTLKQIFDKQKKNSKELNQMRQKFNPEIKMQVQMIFACQEDTKQILKSVQLASNLVSSTLVQEFDQLSICIVDKSDNYISTFMPFTKTSQIKLVMRNIIEDILNKTSSNQTQELIEQFNQLEEEDNDLNIFTGENLKESRINRNGQSIKLEQDAKLQFIFEEKFEKEVLETNYISLNNNNEFITLNKNQPSSMEFSLLTKSDTLLGNVPNQMIHLKIPKLKQNEGDEIISMQTISKSISVIQVEVPQPRKIDRNYIFHMSIRKSLNELFKNQFQFQMEEPLDYEEMVSLSQIQINKNEMNNIANQQFKFFVYCTDEIQIIQNNIFEYLCKILMRWNIKLMIYTQHKGNNFLEQQPDLTYSYQNQSIIRIFYSNKKLINYLENCRNKICKNIFPTTIQHF